MLQEVSRSAIRKATGRRFPSSVNTPLRTSSASNSVPRTPEAPEILKLHLAARALTSNANSTKSINPPVREPSHVSPEAPLDICTPDSSSSQRNQSQKHELLNLASALPEASTSSQSPNTPPSSPPSSRKHQPKCSSAVHRAVARSASAFPGRNRVVLASTLSSTQPSQSIMSTCTASMPPEKLPHNSESASPRLTPHSSLAVDSPTASQSNTRSLPSASSSSSSSSTSSRVTPSVNGQDEAAIPLPSSSTSMTSSFVAPIQSSHRLSSSIPHLTQSQPSSQVLPPSTKASAMTKTVSAQALRQSIRQGGKLRKTGAFPTVSHHGFSESGASMQTQQVPSTNLRKTGALSSAPHENQHGFLEVAASAQAQAVPNTSGREAAVVPCNPRQVFRAQSASTRASKRPGVIRVESTQTKSAARTTDCVIRAESIQTTSAARTTDCVIREESIQTTSVARTTDRVIRAESIQTTSAARTTDCVIRAESIQTTSAARTTDRVIRAESTQAKSVTSTSELSHLIRAESAQTQSATSISEQSQQPLTGSIESGLTTSAWAPQDSNLSKTGALPSAPQENQHGLPEGGVSSQCQPQPQPVPSTSGQKAAVVPCNPRQVYRARSASSYSVRRPRVVKVASAQTQPVTSTSEQSRQLQAEKDVTPAASQRQLQAPLPASPAPPKAVVAGSRPPVVHRVRSASSRLTSSSRVSKAPPTVRDPTAQIAEEFCRKLTLKVVHMRMPADDARIHGPGSLHSEDGHPPGAGGFDPNGLGADVSNHELNSFAALLRRRVQNTEGLEDVVRNPLCERWVCLYLSEGEGGPIEVYCQLFPMDEETWECEGTRPTLISTFHGQDLSFAGCKHRYGNW
eukprot:gene15557-21651_t